jgi:sporulation protein YlmC with PRC-barrel domain
MESAENIKIIEPPKVLSVSTLRGIRVTNVMGQELGKVEDIMLDIKFARIACVFILFGSIADNKLVVVPWEVLSISYHDQKFILNVSEATFNSMEGFDRNKMPDLFEYRWLEKAYLYFSREPYWK